MPLAFLVSAASAVLAVLLGNTRALWARTVRWPGRLRRPPWRGPVAAAASVLLAGSAATLLGIGHAYWACVAAVAVVTGRTPRHQLTRAVERVAGTFLGLVTAVVLMSVLHDESLSSW